MQFFEKRIGSEGADRFVRFFRASLRGSRIIMAPCKSQFISLVFCDSSVPRNDIFLFLVYYQIATATNRTLSPV